MYAYIYMHVSLTNVEEIYEVGVMESFAVYVYSGKEITTLPASVSL